MRSIGVIFSVIFTLAFVLILSFALITQAAQAADGDFDPTFDVDGKLTTDFSSTEDGVRAIVIQPDGKMVAAGTTQVSGTNYNFAVARYNPNGSLDTTFSGDGRVTTGVTAGADVVLAVALQPDGKIVAVGYCTVGQTSFNALVRYNQDGTLDTTFGTGGIAGGVNSTILSGVVVQADGKIVTSAYSNDVATSFSVYRWNANGTLDTSFGDQGRVTTDFFGGLNGAYAIALQPDGKIVAAGTTRISGSNYDVAIVRYLTNGDLDTSFAGTGKLNLNYQDGDDAARSVDIAPDGKIYIAGTVYSAATGYDFTVMRVHPSGVRDGGFDFDGYAVAPIGTGTSQDVAMDMLIQPDGKVVATGYGHDSADGIFALVRFLDDGALDSTFGTGGKLTHDFSGGDSLAYSVAIQSDGKLVSGGIAYMGSTNDYDFALARYASTIAVTPTPTPLPTVCAISFTDVPQGSTFYSFVTCIYCQGIIGGYETGCETGNPCFRPNNNLTRGQLAKIVSNASNYNQNFSTSTFEDVPVGSTFHLFVERLVASSVIGGYPCGGPGEPCGTGNKPYFRPNANVTRGQTAKIVYLAASVPAPPNRQFFEDVPISHTFWEHITGLYFSEVISGYDCGGAGEPCGPDNMPYFRPSANVTRGQSSKIITKAYFPDCGEQPNRSK